MLAIAAQGGLPAAGDGAGAVTENDLTIEVGREPVDGAAVVQWMQAVRRGQQRLHQLWVQRSPSGERDGELGIDEPTAVVDDESPQDHPTLRHPPDDSRRHGAEGRDLPGQVGVPEQAVQADDGPQGRAEPATAAGECAPCLTRSQGHHGRLGVGSGGRLGLAAQLRNLHDDLNLHLVARDAARRWRGPDRLRKGRRLLAMCALTRHLPRRVGQLGRPVAERRRRLG